MPLATVTMTATELILTVALFQLGWCRPDADRHPLTIIGGHQVRIEQAPYMASLRLNGSYHWCGASIIHEQFIVTAAHCIKPDREFKILVGTDNIYGKGQLFDIEDINIHEDYNAITHENDICLIKLKQPLTFGPKVEKVVLADEGFKVKTGSMLNVTGWGRSEVDEFSPKLLQVEVPKITKKECRKFYGILKQRITTQMICAGKSGRDSCQGDSGGPLTIGSTLVGVTSFGIGCGTGPGVYARVACYRTWIQKGMNM